MENIIWQCLLYLFLLTVLAWPLGKYMGKVMDGEPFWLQSVLAPCERALYRLMGVNPAEQMSWKRYLACVLVFSAVSLVLLAALLMAQHVLPLNPQGVSGASWHLALNTAISFVTNTNWQSYAGENAMSYLSQMAGLTVQNFVSAAAGIAVLFALIRGLRASGGARPGNLGSFWADATRAVLYILLPLSLVMSLLLIWQGVPQNFTGYRAVALMEPFAAQDGTSITQQLVPLGPQASQVSPKQLGTNGGGFNGVNSAHPHENPSPVSNLLEMLALLLVPAGLCFTFGTRTGDMRQGIAIFAAMFILLAAAVGLTVQAELTATPQITQGGQVLVAPQGGLQAQAGGNMEGKETRFGIAGSALWAAATTAV